MSQNIPKIPLASFTAEGPEGDKGSKRVVEALREFGFLYVSDVESTGTSEEVCGSSGLLCRLVVRPSTSEAGRQAV
jgi:hypothetical protein